MHSYKGKNPLAAVDSFDTSLKQIHNTNKLLNSIETKLTDFFSNEPIPGKATTPKEETFKENISMIHSRSSQKLHKDENYSNPGRGFVSSPLNEREFSQYLSPSDDTRPQRITTGVTSPTQFRSQERMKPLSSIDNLPKRDEWDRFERN